MRIEWIFAAAVLVSVLMLFLVIHRTVGICARTIFAQPPEPTPEELEASQTPCILPEAVDVLPDSEERLFAEQAAQQAVCSWMQAVNNQDETLLMDAAEGLREALAVWISKQTAQGARERFEHPKAHGSVICAIDCKKHKMTVCVSAQAVYYIASGGQLISGREDLPEQTLWELVCTDFTTSPLQFHSIQQIRGYLKS